MADKLQKVPVKGILKSSSFDKNEPVKSFEKTGFGRGHKEMKWDEMNILQTLHPADKDYGHMKISEPKTPYSYYRDPEDDSREPKSEDEADGLDADLLAKKIQLGSTEPPKALLEDSSEEDDEDDQSDEMIAKRKHFEQKRKLHYNEFYAIKLARKLMEQDDDDDEEDDEENPRSTDDDDEDACSASVTHSKKHAQAASTSSGSRSSSKRATPDVPSHSSTPQPSKAVEEKDKS